jgi:hypothetical protein
VAAKKKKSLTLHLTSFNLVNNGIEQSAKPSFVATQNMHFSWRHISNPLKAAVNKGQYGI